MQLFRSEEDVAEWSRSTGVGVGAVFAPETLWRLAMRWYDDRLDRHWRRRARDERQSILAQAGLRGSFWSLEP